jgi:hypothetical protein
MSGCSTVSQIPEPKVLPPVVVEDERAEGRLSYKADKTYTAKDRADLAKAEALINEVTQTSCFRGYFENEKTRSKLVQTNGKTRRQVVDHISSAKKEFPVRMYYTSKNVIGYRQPPSIRINTNSKYHRSKNFSVCSKASNLLHESVHGLGYTHDFNRTARRPYSVPYTAGSALDYCVKKNPLCK